MAALNQYQRPGLTSRRMVLALKNIVGVTTLILVARAFMLLPAWSTPLGYMVLTSFVLGVLFICRGTAGNMRLWTFYVLGFTSFLYLRAVADDIGMTHQFAYPISLERVLLLGNIPSVWLQDLLYAPGRQTVLDIYLIAVYGSYFVLPHVVALFLWRTRQRVFEQFAIAIIVAYSIGLIFYAAVPTAPPWLAAEQGHLPAVTRVAKVATGNAAGADKAREIAEANEVGAMPSLHMAITALVALVFQRYGRGARALALAYVISMGVALVYLGEHYVVDELAGLLVAVVAWRYAAEKGAVRLFLMRMGVIEGGAVPPGRRIASDPEEALAPAA